MKNIGPYITWWHEFIFGSLATDFFINKSARMWDEEEMMNMGNDILYKTANL